MISALEWSRIRAFLRWRSSLASSTSAAGVGVIDLRMYSGASSAPKIMMQCACGTQMAILPGFSARTSAVARTQLRASW